MQRFKLVLKLLKILNLSVKFQFTNLVFSILNIYAVIL